MALSTINAKMLSKMFLAGAKNLELKKEWINELNVFPVPDGDTGTNMTLTIMSAAGDVSALQDADMETVAKAISSGSLRGARGNSGVILSQLFRGFSKVIKQHEEIDISIMTEALDKAVETAYKAVMKPKEGTILTVARGIAEKAEEIALDAENMEEFLGEIIAHAEYVLSQTPEMLPVLKQAGVVDSGGQGLVEILKGGYDAFLGKELDFSITEQTKPAYELRLDAGAEEEIKFGYCTEFIVLLSKPFQAKHEKEFKDFLQSMGDSIVVVADEDIVKVHVHTNDPGLAIQRALKYGALSNMKIDNMRLEHSERIFKQQEALAGSQVNDPIANQERKETGFVAVSVGEGMNKIFKSLGVDYLIEGGQTMNPSTDDVLQAIAHVNADTVFVLPNNKNIILAAEQAKKLEKEKNIIVMPTKTVPQGIAAVINYLPDLSVVDNEAVMLTEIGRVKTGQVTYAVRDTIIDGKEIKQGDYMGVGDKTILSVGEVLEDTVEDMLTSMVNEEAELISIYYGADIKEEDALHMKEKIEQVYASCDVEFQYGGQPVYYYIISVE